MTLGHWMFAAAMTLYMGAAAIIEERDLERHFGSLYRDYQQRSADVIPRLARSENNARKGSIVGVPALGGRVPGRPAKAGTPTNHDSSLSLRSE